MSLKEYNRKRDFEKTAEPSGRLESFSKNRFVIQKHEASRLHYDFRLEINGTLKSWAVPKGIPFKKGEKRLAVQVEDHPVSYIDFEGTIPKGQYGGGTVMVWDKGTFQPLSDAPAKDLASGKLHFLLKGKKLHGEWYLVRLRDGNNWLLIRAKKDMSPVSKKGDDTSALSGKTMTDVAKGNNVWHSNRSEEPTTTQAPKQKRARVFTPTFISPMKALLVKTPPKGEWLYEIKFDGFRALAFKKGSSVRLLSRNEKDFGGKFPQVLESLNNLKAADAVIDGEIVALDSKGRSSFQLLQAHDLRDERPPIVFYAFDLLKLDGRDLRKCPVTTRKQLLDNLLGKSSGVLRYSGSLEGSIDKLLVEARRLGLEGLIGKRKNSVYEAGRRSGAWIKLKLHQEQEMVIGGFTDPEGSRESFGALLIGYYAKDGLYYAGKVGTGFSDAGLKSLYVRLRELGTAQCPFVNLPEKKSGRFGAGLTASAMKKCHWVKPELVCQVKFAEWTRDGKLRHAVFLGLREDKAAQNVIREIPA